MGSTALKLRVSNPMSNAFAASAAGLKCAWGGERLGRLDMTRWLVLQGAPMARTCPTSPHMPPTARIMSANNDVTAC